MQRFLLDDSIRKKTFYRKGRKGTYQYLIGDEIISVRGAVGQDLPRIIEIAQQSVTAAQWSRDAYEQMFSLSDRVVLVIESNPGDRVCGFLAAHEVLGEWEIENLAIGELDRRRGLGLLLLHEFLRLVRDRHGKEVFLEVRESNVAARALYSKCTFVEAARRRSYYQDPEEDALILKFSFLQ